MNASVRTSDPVSQSSLGLAFRKPRPDDIAWARPILLSAQRMGCEFSFGNVYAWCEKYGTEIARINGFFLSRCTTCCELSAQRAAYCFPIGSGELQNVIPLLREQARQMGIPLTLYGLNAADIDRLNAAYPGVFRYEHNRDDADYIYRREDLAALAGKKYHQKRNHIARFMRDNNWRYEAISPENLDDCMDMAREWERRNSDKDPEALQAERRALERSFAHFEDFALRGGALRVAGEIIAFTLGEELSERCFCTHFEKAFAEYTGAYQMINRCFAAESLQAYEYVNREEDLGNEGLRKAKLSYYPEILLEKYKAVELI